MKRNLSYQLSKINTSNITYKQIQLMKNTIGLSRKKVKYNNYKAYRNYFCISNEYAIENEDYVDLIKLVHLKLVEYSKHEKLTYFHLTDLGFEFIKEVFELDKIEEIN